MANKCPHDPRALAGAPIGMYHCPECGEMVLAGLAHPTDEDYREEREAMQREYEREITGNGEQNG
ncbi:MAG TPA: hypothetical protein VJA26_18640 [Gammaproteobacteria bacterium]|nr:hypothetical protein [Gammaproteobacteria bacterium]